MHELSILIEKDPGVYRTYVTTFENRNIFREMTFRLHICFLNHANAMQCKAKACYLYFWIFTTTKKGLSRRIFYGQLFSLFLQRSRSLTIFLKKHLFYKHCCTCCQQVFLCLDRYYLYTFILQLLIHSNKEVMSLTTMPQICLDCI